MKKKVVAGNYQTPDDSQEDDEDFRIRNADQLPTLYSTDWTCGTAVNQIVRNIIDLNPRFQRRDAWNVSDKSRFIESLALHIPIPQVILAEHPEQKKRYIVIDGKQRLLTLIQFMGEEDKLPEGFRKFKLTNLNERRDLIGKTFEDVKDTPDGLSIENAVIRTVIISGVTDDNFLYEVFLRLNTQSKKLSPQELRQALAPGKFTDYIDDAATESDAVRRALNIKEPDRRMRDNELVLRYFSFKLMMQEYQGDFKEFLDSTTIHFNNEWDDQRQNIEASMQGLNTAIDTVFDVFGPSAFQVYEPGEYTGRFNRAVFDVMTYYFSEPGVRKVALKNAPAVKRAFQTLCVRNRKFRNALSANTKDPNNVYLRFSLWGDALREVLGIKLPQLDLVDNRISVHS